MESLIITVFVFCAAFVAGSILLGSHLMKKYNLPFLRFLIYYLIFSFTFGAYSIWGQFVIVFIASPELSSVAVSSISIIALIFGLPFLVFAWLMLLRFSAGAAGKRFRDIYTALFLIVNFGIITLLGVIAGGTSYIKALPYIKLYYAAAGLICSLITAATILLTSRSMPPLNINNRIMIAAITLTGTIAQSLALLFIKQDVWMALVVSFLLFGFTAAIPVYLKYFAVFRVTGKPKTETIKSMDQFLGRFDISPRESDIIKEICAGLSNQEIADKLFISLQTVKDHTHRIYVKTNVRNRMQLMAKVRETETGENRR